MSISGYIVAVAMPSDRCSVSQDYAMRKTKCTPWGVRGTRTPLDTPNRVTKLLPAGEFMLPSSHTVRLCEISNLGEPPVTSTREEVLDKASPEDLRTLKLKQPTEPRGPPSTA